MLLASCGGGGGRGVGVGCSSYRYNGVVNGTFIGNGSEVSGGGSLVKLGE